MRRAFVNELRALARQDPRIVLLTADLGFSVLEPFAQEFPQRFFNVGVAEQNMLGLATGLALGGRIPFVYSMASFVTMRAYEFIRNGPLLHRLPVRIIGVGGGFSYALNGFTHFGLEDIALLRVQPCITVIAPADFQQAVTALRKTWDSPLPVYYRLGKDETARVKHLEGRFELGRAYAIGNGKDAVLITTGEIAAEVSAARELLSSRGIACTMLVAASISPAPVEDLRETLAHCKLAVAVEGHYTTGGLGSLVAEVVSEHGLFSRLIRLGVGGLPDARLGSQQFLLARHSLTAREIARVVEEGLQKHDAPKGRTKNKRGGGMLP